MRCACFLHIAYAWAQYTCFCFVSISFSVTTKNCRWTCVWLDNNDYWVFDSCVKQRNWWININICLHRAAFENILKSRWVIGLKRKIANHHFNARANWTESLAQQHILTYEHVFVYVCIRIVINTCLYWLLAWAPNWIIRCSADFLCLEIISLWLNVCDLDPCRSENFAWHRKLNANAKVHYTYTQIFEY